MGYVDHTITISGDEEYGGRLPLDPTGVLLRTVPKALKQSVLMAFEGRTTRRGPSLGWLERATDVRLVDISGKAGDGDSKLHFEVPRLGEAAEELYQQQELWDTRPSPEDTCFDLFGDVIQDVRKEEENSRLFDTKLLKGFKKYGDVLKSGYSSVSLSGNRTTEDTSLINHQVVESASRMIQETPASHRVRIVGVLDMIRASTKAFAIKLDDDQEVPGVCISSDTGNLSDLFQQRILILGTAVYRPSGSLLRVDAEHVELAGDEPALWSRMPQAPNRKLEPVKFRKSQGPKSGLAAIIGKWPGNESDEEVEAALRQIS